MYKKFSVYPLFLSGCTNGNPFDVLNEMAARVGNLAISLIAVFSLCFGSLMSKFSLKNYARAPTTPHMMAIGCALDSNPL